MKKREGAAAGWARRRMQNVKAALEFAGQLVDIGVKPKTAIVSIKAQHHLSTRSARLIWWAKTRKAYRRH